MKLFSSASPRSLASVAIYESLSSLNLQKKINIDVCFENHFGILKEVFAFMVTFKSNKNIVPGAAVICS